MRIQQPWCPFDGFEELSVVLLMLSQPSHTPRLDDSFRRPDVDLVRSMHCPQEDPFLPPRVCSRCITIPQLVHHRLTYRRQLPPVTMSLQSLERGFTISADAPPRQGCTCCSHHPWQCSMLFVQDQIVVLLYSYLEDAELRLHITHR
eukprot:6487100-Amphidinium_carterae.1